jgi:UDP:flavonoid glycosyltransferase YjiC (YdhE family)
MRFLFATTGGTGHLTPMLPFGHALERAGHDVLVAGSGSAGTLSRREGLAYRALAEPVPSELDAIHDRLRSLSNDDATEPAIQDMFVRTYAAAAMPDMLHLVKSWRPDVVLRESTEFVSCLAAERCGVPQARIGFALSAANEDWILALAAPALDELRDRLHMPPDPNAARMRSTPCLTQSPRLMDLPGGHELSPVRRYRAQPAETRAPFPDWWNGSADPLVYLSFGTVLPQDGYPEMYRAAIDALDGLSIRLLVTVGRGQDPTELGELPPSVHVEQWVPQAAVMPHAQAMVGHGGAGTTLAALAGGVPTVFLPVFADQPINAARVAEFGAGLVLDMTPAGLERLGTSMRELLEDPRYRAAAREVADEIASLPPVDESVELIEALARQPGAWTRPRSRPLRPGGLPDLIQVALIIGKTTRFTSGMKIRMKSRTTAMLFEPSARF